MVGLLNVGDSTLDGLVSELRGAHVELGWVLDDFEKSFDIAAFSTRDEAKDAMVQPLVVTRLTSGEYSKYIRIDAGVGDTTGSTRRLHGTQDVDPVDPGSRDGGS